MDLLSEMPKDPGGRPTRLKRDGTCFGEMRPSDRPHLWISITAGYGSVGTWTGMFGMVKRVFAVRSRDVQFCPLL